MSNAAQSSQDLASASTGALFRGFIVYTALSFPSFVDASPTILKAATSIPIIKQISLFVVRHTFFKQFVGGETFQDTIPLVQDLRARNLASMLDYSVEVDEDAAKQSSKSSKKALTPYEQNIQEIKKLISEAAALENSRENSNAFTRKTFVAIKLSALLPSAESLEHFSTALVRLQKEPDTPFSTDLLYQDTAAPELTESDLVDLRQLNTQIKEIGALAVQHQIRVLFDAEHTWYQPAIDAFTTDLMKETNSWSQGSPVSPVIYLTFQAYLRSTPARLKNYLAHAKSNGYTLGVKLVRGAYHPLETEHHTKNPANKGTLPPVWSEKRETDECYGRCATMLLDHVSSPDARSTPNKAPTVGLLFGTHNKDSCELIMNGLVERGFASLNEGTGVLTLPQWVSGQVQLGQLYGMADELTSYVAGRLQCPDAPMVLKCIPYGSLEDVMPYLGRRAIENKSVLGNSNTSIERQRIGRELKKRLFG